jgi:hypothetical protein
MESVRALVDRLGSANEESRTKLQQAGAASTSATRANGLKFTVADRVIDQASGQRGAVRQVQRLAGSDHEWYLVALDDARLVMRGPDELEADTTPAPVTST